MTERIREFLRDRNDDGPCLVVDLDVVRDNYNAFAKALPDTRVFYAVKANPAPEVLSLLAGLGSCFDTASVAEIEMVLAAGATPDRISYGNTIKKERDIARAFALGVRLFAVDCKAEVEKIARAAPGSKVFCRILSDCAGAEWPLSRKFGCEPAMAVDVLEHALELGLEAHGVSFHVGSQQRNQHAWDRALESAAADLPRLRRARHQPRHGQSRRRLPDQVPEEGAGGEDLRHADLPGAAQALRQPHPGDHHRAGPRHGRQCRRDRGRGRARLQEERGGRRALGLSRHRQVRRPRRDHGRVDPLPDPHAARRRRGRPCVLAGPTCDSVDVLYEKQPYELPVSLEIGDKVLIEGTGAYTATYASVAFNGFAPLKTYHI